MLGLGYHHLLSVCDVAVVLDVGKDGSSCLHGGRGTGEMVREMSTLGFCHLMSAKKPVERTTGREEEPFPLPSQQQ